MIDSAHDVILKNPLVLLPRAVIAVCMRTLHAHAVQRVAEGTTFLTAAASDLAPREQACSRGLQYSTELTIAIGSSNVASLICLGVGMERISPVSAGE